MIDICGNANTSLAVGPGLRQALLHSVNCFSVTLRDAKGKPLAPREENIRALDVRVSVEDRRLPVDVQCNKDGSFPVSYGVPAKAAAVEEGGGATVLEGQLSLSVIVCGQHLPDSPYVVPLLQHAVTLGTTGIPGAGNQQFSAPNGVCVTAE